MIWDSEELAWIFPVLTVEDLANYLGVDLETDPEEAPGLEAQLEVATAYVQHVVSACLPLNPIPAAIYKSVVLEVAGEWGRRKSNGTVQRATFDGQVPVRGARDPLTYSFPILRRWLPGGFA